MKNNISPLRKCVVCNQMIEREQMLRVVRTKEGNVFLDTNQKANGRGAYVCKNSSCITKAIAKKSFVRTLKCQVPPIVFDEIERTISDV